MIVDCAVYENGSRRAGELSSRRRAASAAATTPSSGSEWSSPRSRSSRRSRASSTSTSWRWRTPSRRISAPSSRSTATRSFSSSRPPATSTPRRSSTSARSCCSSTRPSSSRSATGRRAALSDVRRAVDARGDLLDCGPGAVVHAIVDHVVDDYEVVTDGVEEDIQQVQAQVFSAERTNPAERIYKLEREVLEFQRAVSPLAPAMNRLMQGDLDVDAAEAPRVLPRRARPPASGRGTRGRRSASCSTARSRPT